MSSIIFHTPSLSISLTGETRAQLNVNHQEVVTVAQQIELSDLRTEYEVSGRMFDCVADVKGTPLAIQFSYKERPEMLVNAENGIAVININLEPLNTLITKRKDNKKTYSEILMDYFCSSMADKKWLYHPRIEKSLAQAEYNLQTKVNEVNKAYDQNNNELLGSYCRQSFRVFSQKHQNRDYVCKNCHEQWPRTSDYICPKCFTPCRE